MKIGAVLPHNEIGSDPGAIKAYLQGVEELRMTHLLIYDHVMGADPDRSGGYSGPYDKDTAFHEPFTFFGFAAAVTNSIELVTTVLILPQRQTVLVAKQAAEVAILSENRLRLGVGSGWKEIEYQALNEDFTNRGVRQADQVELMRKLWSSDAFSYTSNFHTVDQASINPRPSQSVPIWFGGSAPALLRRPGNRRDPPGRRHPQCRRNRRRRPPHPHRPVPRRHLRLSRSSGAASLRVRLRRTRWLTRGTGEPNSAALLARTVPPVASNWDFGSSGEAAMPEGMDVRTAVKSRYSVRGYRPDSVPDETVREVFELARLAQSGTNNQPWHIAVVSGAACDDLRRRLCARFDAGDSGERDFAAPADPLPDALMERRRTCGYSYYATMGVERSDREGRAAIARKNFELFDAPHAAFFSMPRTLGISGAVDMGILLQTVTLLMLDRGIGSIAQGALANYPDTVREVAKIPEDNGIVFGMSFGYEDPEALINTVRMPRESLDDVASFVG